MIARTCKTQVSNNRKAKNARADFVTTVTMKDLQPTDWAADARLIHGLSYRYAPHAVCA